MGRIAQLAGVGKNFASRMQEKNMPAFAGSCAYFFFLSLVPLLIVLASILPYTTITQNDLIRAITGITPHFADDIVTELIEEAYEKSVAVFSVSALVTIWSGAQGMLSIIRGLNGIYDVKEKRNYFVLRLIASFYTVGMIIIMLAMLLVMVFEEIVRTIAVSHFPKIMYIVSLSSHLKFVVVIAISTLAFALIYTFVPSIKLTFIYQLPGAVFSAVVWYLFSWLFSLYVEMSGSFSVYGSIATTLVMMVWLYFCITIFLIGAFINNFFHPVVKVFYNDRRRKSIKKKIRKKSSAKSAKQKKYNEFK